MWRETYHLPGELENIRQKLKCNNYPPHKVSNELPPPRRQTGTQPKSRVVLPYLEVASHKIQRNLKEANTEVRHNPSTNLQSIFTTHKDKRHSKSLPKVYYIPYECGKVGIGETGHAFATRLKEHQAHGRHEERDKSAIIQHAHTCERRIPQGERKLITLVPNWYQRRVREALKIEVHDTVLQNSGLHLSDIWLALLDRQAN